MTCFPTILLAGACVLAPAMARAQAPAPPQDQSDPDARVDALQPDFNLAALPTTLRMPVGKMAFRVTHRFGRPLGEGDFGDLRLYPRVRILSQWKHGLSLSFSPVVTVPIGGKGSFAGDGKATLLPQYRGASRP